MTAGHVTDNGDLIHADRLILLVLITEYDH